MTNTVTLSNSGGNNASLVVDGVGSSTGALGGALLAGDLTLFVDNSSGKFSGDDLGRIQDAVAQVESIVSPFGTNVVMVDGSVGNAANIVISMDTTSAVGGMADGVLGCTTDAGGVKIIQGWNWYAGATASAIGCDQFDLQTVMVHEIGHTLGLGHSADTSSVMNATLAAGQVKRGLDVADLNISDDDGGGAHGLHATLPSMPAAGGSSSTIVSVPTGTPIVETASPAMIGPVVNMAASQPAAAIASPVGTIAVGGGRQALTAGQVNPGRGRITTSTHLNHRTRVEVGSHDPHEGEPNGASLHDLALEQMLGRGIRLGRRPRK